MKKKIYFLIPFVTLTLLALYWLRNTPQKEEKNKDNTLLNVGIILTPTNIKVEGENETGGLQTELFRMLLPKDSITVKLFTNRQSSIEALQMHKIDILAASIPQSNLFEEEGIRATTPLYASGLALLHRKDTLPLNLNNTTIHYPNGREEIAEMIRNLNELSYPELKGVPRNMGEEALCMEILMRKIDFTICNRQLAEIMTARFPMLAIENSFSYDSYQTWLVNAKDTLLLQRLNDSISVKGKTTEWHNILKKYGVEK